MDNPFAHRIQIVEEMFCNGILKHSLKTNFFLSNFDFVVFLI